MIFFRNVLRKLIVTRKTKGINNALSLHRRGEGRRDGLTLTQASHRLEIEWRARDVHPWDRSSEPEERERLFTEQSIADADAALSRLFNELPEIDVIEFSVTHPDSHQRILAGTVERAARVPSRRGLSPRTRLWHRGVSTTILAILVFRLASGTHCAQSQHPTASTIAESSSTSTNLFVMFGSDFDRPGLLPRTNHNIGIGYTYGFSKKDLIGDELTFRPDNRSLIRRFRAITELAL
jgi:hypothetical protein